MSQTAMEIPTTGPYERKKNTLIRVLLVDDEAALLKVAKQCLEMEGNFQVDAALSVEEALQKMKDKTFDAIVCDYVMPERNGLEFLKELRDNGNDIPFVILTGKGREEVIIKALNYGANQYFCKSGDPEKLYGELTRSLRQVVKRKRTEETRDRIENVLHGKPNIRVEVTNDLTKACELIKAGFEYVCEMEGYRIFRKSI